MICGLTSSRAPRDGQRIHPNTTASWCCFLNAFAKKVISPSGTSSTELTRQIQKPVTSSDTGSNGPSVTLAAPGEIPTRLPQALGCRPSPERRRPASANTSLYWPIAVNRSVDGITPGSLFCVALMMSITRMSLSPSVS